ncbi:hypothetical protein [Corallococcus sp. EGB]|uniref:hypothetical protein n=1 Tax=Corallococcus sp. EGB TaxID=1521117 RepID=UPI001CC11D4C|nr:hypothetical protein [Corallococcus sp. EGB]
MLGRRGDRELKERIRLIEGEVPKLLEQLKRIELKPEMYEANFAEFERRRRESQAIAVMVKSYLEEHATLESVFDRRRTRLLAWVAFFVSLFSLAVATYGVWKK